MLKKLATTAALAGASLAIMAPAASATTVHFGGVYPNFSAAKAACHDGINQGRWWGCSYRTPAPGPQTELWVQVG
ncbi:hypothetical protein CFN78_23115 [Amycolatopsis antarctica]|uniref:Chitin-binding type-3 domain-containing protein n=1 Tax=Amycolatopsis antarctica TaxID=1854586 RepID=A0A263CXD9_9PSEU|nr:hypothetical protein [Amycolatopsis antarctica]OZM70814.1 hypothetical protein CFN78_23115 [Amycolatopsis antarctica]